MNLEENAVNHYFLLLTVSQQTLVFTFLQYKSFENTGGKGKIAHNEQFFVFPQCFLLILRTLSFSSNLELCSGSSFYFEEPKIWVWERVHALFLPFWLYVSVFKQNLLYHAWKILYWKQWLLWTSPFFFPSPPPPPPHVFISVIKQYFSLSDIY